MQIFGVVNIGRYQYGHNVNRFCKICDVPIDIDVIGPPEEITKDWTGKRREFLKGAKQMHPINTRLLDGVEWEGRPGETAAEGVEGKVKIKKVDGQSFGSVYRLDKS